MLNHLDKLDNSNIDTKDLYTYASNTQLHFLINSDNLNASWNTSSSTCVKLDQLLVRQQQVLEQNKNEKDMNN
jgi:hypothetical protein